MVTMYSQQLEQVRKDLRAAVWRDFRGDILKTLLYWLILPTVFYFATKDNKLLGPTSNLPMFLAFILILLLVPVLRFQLWKYSKLLHATKGTIQKKRSAVERVARTDRNTGYVTGWDMVPANVLHLTFQTKDDKSEKNKMLGNHLYALGQAYYQEGDEVERLVGARYLYNPSKKLDRPFCLRCGYIGAPNELRCSRCRCTMLPITESNDQTEPE